MMPSPLSVQQRDIHFSLQDVDLANWHGAGPHVSQFFNAMSVLFPEGERFFIESVRHYRPQITDPQLQADVKGFIGQEAMHGREHRAYNAALTAAGYDMPAMERQALFLLNVARRMPRVHQLAITICLEHFTSIMADALLQDERALAGAHPQMAALWRWHAIEETEHKAVAFDVYQQVARGPLAYLRRCAVMLSVSVFFVVQTNLNQIRLMRQDRRLSDWRGWLKLLRFQFVSPGPMRRIFLPWLSWFRPGFHPWQHDNSARVEQWKQSLEHAGHAHP